MLALTKSVNPSDAPRLWKRLKEDKVKGVDSKASLSSAKLKEDNQINYSEKLGQAKAYILLHAEEYADSFPTVSSKSILCSVYT